ncbi:hypothetical protein M9458_015795, partial [Cirrhinus mrigala]
TSFFADLRDSKPLAIETPSLRIKLNQRPSAWLIHRFSATFSIAAAAVPADSLPPSGEPNELISK